jgi:hypothetical protein
MAVIGAGGDRPLCIVVNPTRVREPRGGLAVGPVPHSRAGLSSGGLRYLLNRG